MSVAEIRAFVEQHPKATAVEIRDALGQEVDNDTIYCFPHPDGRKGKAYFVRDVSRDFFDNLQEFIRADDVEVTESVLEHLITDRKVYPSKPGLHYFPILLTIKQSANS